jgi:hypothetical protein
MERETLMTHEKRAEGNPPPAVSTEICNGFEAEPGAEVTFTNAEAGAEIVQSGTVWPFFEANLTTPYGPPIGPFPLPGVTKIYVGNFAVGDNIPYTVANQTCTNAIQKSVTIISGAMLKKSA